MPVPDKRQLYPCLAVLALPGLAGLGSAMRRYGPVVGPHENLTIAGGNSLRDFSRRLARRNRSVRSKFSQTKTHNTVGEIDIVDDPFGVDPIFETMRAMEVQPALPTLLDHVDVVAPSKPQSTVYHPVGQYSGSEPVETTVNFV